MVLSYPSRYHDADELRALGMDRLKEALEAFGLKCGGTLEQRADRLFSIKGKAPEDIDPQLKVNFGRARCSEVGRAAFFHWGGTNHDHLRSTMSLRIFFDPARYRFFDSVLAELDSQLFFVLH